jgi:hypothetical protein
MPAAKPFTAAGNGPLSPALRMLAITPDNSNDVATAFRMIYVGTGGDVVVVDTEGNTVTHKNAGSGTYLGPFQVARVMATNTTAQNLIGYV